MKQKMTLTYRATLLLLILGLSLLGACGQEAATVPAPATATTETAAVSPLPTATTEAASEPVAEPTLVPTPNLTPSPGLGIVRGTLTIGGALAQNETLYLAPIVLTGESMSIAGLDTNTAPRTETDATGAFAFLDVPPGDYALAAVGPLGPVIVPGPDGDEVTTTVQAGETSDLGDIAAPPFH
jgi:hypothetical protein